MTYKKDNIDKKIKKLEEHKHYIDVAIHKLLVEKSKIDSDINAYEYLKKSDCCE